MAAMRGISLLPFFGRGLAIMIIAMVELRSGIAFAQPYPSRSIKIVVGQAPGGQTDIIARIIGQKFSELWGQSIIIENRPGAGGTIGAELVARAPADGHTLLLGSQSNLAVAIALDRNLPYNTTRDFAPIGRVAYVCYALVVNPRVPAKTVIDLVAYARSHPGALTFASSGSTSLSRLAFELFKRSANVDLLAVPYKDSATALVDLLAGRIDMMITDIGVVSPQARLGALRMMAILGNARSHLAPEVPTFAEQGIPDVAVSQWYGLVAPKGTSPETAATLESGLTQVLRMPDVRTRFEELDYEPIEETSAQFDKVIRSDIRTFSTLAERIGTKASQ